MHVNLSKLLIRSLIWFDNFINGHYLMTSKASIHNINHLRFKLHLGEDERMNIPISAQFLIHLNSRVNERTIGITYKQVKFNDN
jgi:hypothetical protein